MKMKLFGLLVGGVLIMAATCAYAVTMVRYEADPIYHEVIKQWRITDEGGTLTRTSNGPDLVVIQGVQYEVDHIAPTIDGYIIYPKPLEGYSVAPLKAVL